LAGRAVAVANRDNSAMSRFASPPACAANAGFDHTPLRSRHTITGVTKMMTKMKSGLAIAIATICLGANAASADDLFAYPPQGRTKSQQEQDQFACHQWAVEQSRFDPVQFAAQTPAVKPASAPAGQTAPSAQTSAQNGNHAMISGAAQGAAVAAVSGGNAGEGAATGAALRMLREARTRRGAEEVRAQTQQQQAQMQAQVRAQQDSQAAQELRSKQQAYQRARGTCFKARGYTVSEG
jgi:hypothetical protein